ncbi:MAG TPA: RluA family pseudouridine synthase [Treponemataceae bacterium]|nr:RluA family pseudouridine synthase [Treponemataceae bacterium]
MTSPIPLTRRISIPPDARGLSLAGYLSVRFTYFDSASWTREIEEGRVLINGRPADPLSLLKPADQLQWTPLPYEEPPVNANWKTLHETDDFIWIEKPAGLPVHPSGIYRENTLWNFLGMAETGYSFINRLDRETSGVVVAAKGSRQAALASRWLQEGLIRKEYRVLVHGAAPEAFEARGYLKPDSASPVRKKSLFVRDDAEPRAQPESGERQEPPIPASSRCETAFERIKKFTLPDGSRGSLLAAFPRTGKTHQIRATLQGSGFPVVGDKLYGLDPEFFIRFIEGSLTEKDHERLILPNQALHCMRMILPIKGVDIAKTVSGIPESWDEVLV